MSWMKCPYCDQQHNGWYKSTNHIRDNHALEKQRDELRDRLASAKRNANENLAVYEKWKVLTTYLNNIADLPDAVRTALSDAVKKVTPWTLKVGYGSEAKTYTVPEWYEMMTQQYLELVAERQAQLDAFVAAHPGLKEPQGG